MDKKVSEKVNNIVKDKQNIIKTDKNSIKETNDKMKTKLWSDMLDEKLDFTKPLELDK